MATSFKITDGTTEYELFYNAASQTTYKQLYGAQLQGVQPNVLMHQPDFDSAVPVRGFNPNRQLYLNLHVPADTTWDGVYDAVTDINRMVDGKDSQALRYWTDGDVNRVAIRVQQDAATNYTDIPVLYGSVNIDTAYFNPTAELNKWGLGIVIALSISPHGEGAAISLKNSLASSPHFIQDSDGDDLADGWNTIGTPTTQLNSVRYLTGGQCQQIVTDASTNEGIRADTVTASSSTAAVAYVWLQSSADPITVNLTDGSDVAVQAKTWDPDSPTVNSDKTAVDAAGTTWYRVSVSGTNTNADFKLLVSRTAGNATEATTFRVDNAYLQLSTSTVPDAWCSTSAIEGRNDPDSSNEDEINYVDVWGCPGDSAPLVLLDLEYQNAISAYYFILGMAHLPGSIPIWAIENTVLAKGIAGTGSWTATQASAGTHHGGSYGRFTEGVTPDGSVLTEGLSSAQMQALQNRAYSVFIVADTSVATTKLTLSVGGSTAGFPTVGFVGTGNFEVVNLGVWNPKPLFSDLVTQNTNFGVEISGMSNGDTLDIDAIFLLPVSDGYVIGAHNANHQNFYVDGPKKVVYTNYGTDDFVGEMWTLPNSTGMNRIQFLAIDKTVGTNLKAYTVDPTVSITLTPRTRHLLGVS